MKSIKFITVLILILIFCLPAAGEKRVKRNQMKELTDPKSPNFVPYPYPKNRTEIIEDLVYHIKRFVLDSDDGSYEVHVDVGKVPITEKILADLLKPQSPYEIGEIFKVKNRIAKIPDNYHWLIMIMDRDGNVAMRVAMFATGLMAACGAEEGWNFKKASPELRKIKERRRRVKTEADVRNVLAEDSARFGDPSKIKKVELSVFLSSMATLIHPIWEIKMTDGTFYYYHQNADMLYAIDKKVKWDKKAAGYLPDMRSLVPPHSLFLADTINDELVVLKEIPRNKK